MNLDIFNNYELQREELLARIAHELQLDKTRLERMESAYNAVSDLLKNDPNFFFEIEISVYAQGSVRIGATVKPINNDDFDLDVVLHIYDSYSKYSPKQIYDALIDAINRDSYYRSICEKKSRCIRLNYKGDFHMDILPGCMIAFYDREKIAIPDKRLTTWGSANPKGYANWFLQIANSVKTILLKDFSERLIKANVETEPLPEEIYSKTPLQRAVQLIKRYRDIYYQDKDYPVSSIVLTTLVAQFYQGEESIFSTISRVVERIIQDYRVSIANRKRFKVFNPVNPEEEFTDTWTDAEYNSFYNFIADFHEKWESLDDSFESSGKDYVELFGEGIYKKSLQEQIKNFSSITSDETTKANALIIGSNAYTDSRGQINSSRGIRNEAHHNFGEK